MTKLRRGVAVIALSAIAAGTGAAGLAGWRTFTADAAGTEIDPIAKYEFKDASNFGKDSMGNYHMQYRNAWMSGGTGPLCDKGTLIEGGGVEFAKEFCIAQDKNNNMFEDVTAFTLAFEIKVSASSDAWGHYIGVSNTGKGKEFYLHAADDGFPKNHYQRAAGRSVESVGKRNGIYRCGLVTRGTACGLVADERHQHVLDRRGMERSGSL